MVPLFKNTLVGSLSTRVPRAQDERSSSRRPVLSPMPAPRRAPRLRFGYWTPFAGIRTAPAYWAINFDESGTPIREPAYGYYPSVFLCFLERRMERVIDLGRRARRPAFTRMSPERTPYLVRLLDGITAGSQIKEPVEVFHDAKASFHDSVTGLQTSFFICLAFGFTIWWAHIPDIIPLTPAECLNPQLLHKLLHSFREGSGEMVCSIQGPVTDNQIPGGGSQATPLDSLYLNGSKKILATLVVSFVALALANNQALATLAS